MKSQKIYVHVKRVEYDGPRVMSEVNFAFAVNERSVLG